MTEFDPQSVVAALRRQVEIYAEMHGLQRLQRPSSLAQARVIARAMSEVLGRERIAVLREIFPFGVCPVASTKHLSVVEASVLIQFLYGLDASMSLGEGSRLAPEAEQLLLALRDQVQARQRQALIDAGQLELSLSDVGE